MRQFNVFVVLMLSRFPSPIFSNTEYLSCDRQIILGAYVMHSNTIDGQYSPYGGQKTVLLVRNFSTPLQCGRSEA